jgi:hypothetical protein
MNDIIEAVRNHPQIGVGSCHPWDECMTDEELAEMLEVCGIDTADAAIVLGLTVLDVWDDRIAEGAW